MQLIFVLKITQLLAVLVKIIFQSCVSFVAMIRIRHNLVAGFINENSTAYCQPSTYSFFSVFDDNWIYAIFTALFAYSHPCSYYIWIRYGSAGWTALALTNTLL